MWTFAALNLILAGAGLTAGIWIVVLSHNILVRASMSPFMALSASVAGVGAIGVVAAFKRATRVSCAMLVYVFLVSAVAAALVWAGTWALAFQSTFSYFVHRHWDVVSILAKGQFVGDAKQDSADQEAQVVTYMTNQAPYAALVLFR